MLAGKILRHSNTFTRQRNVYIIRVENIFQGLKMPNCEVKLFLEQMPSLPPLKAQKDFSRNVTQTVRVPGSLSLLSHGYSLL